MVARNRGEFEAPDNLEKQALAQRQCPARKGVAEVLSDPLIFCKKSLLVI